MAHGTSTSEWRRSLRPPTPQTNGELFSSEPRGSRQLFPTPSATDAKAGGSRNTETSSAHAGVSLTDFVATGDSTGRAEKQAKKLNPLFVAWLMGLPPWWALPIGIGETLSGVSGTASCRSKQQQRSDC